MSDLHLLPSADRASIATVTLNAQIRGDFGFGAPARTPVAAAKDRTYVSCAILGRSALISAASALDGS